MKPKYRIAQMACLLAATLTCSGAAQALELYDTFRGTRLDGIKGKYIDPALWDAWNSHAALEVVKKRQGGVAVLGTVTHGGTGSDTGRVSGRSALAFPESVGEFITEIQATVQTTKVALSGDCEINGDNGRLRTPRIGGFWFNDGRGQSDEDQTGSMFAAIEVRRRNSDDAITDRKNPMWRSNRLQVIGSVFHCNDPDCTQSAGFDEVKTLGVINRGQRRRVRVQWDKDNNRFLFQLHRNDPVEIVYGESISDDDAPPKFWKRIEHRGQPENCTSARTATVGEVRIFDVHVNEEAIPD